MLLGGGAFGEGGGAPFGLKFGDFMGMDCTGIALGERVFSMAGNSGSRTVVARLAAGHLPNAFRKIMVWSASICSYVDGEDDAAISRDGADGRAYSCWITGRADQAADSARRGALPCIE